MINAKLRVVGGSVNGATGHMDCDDEYAALPASGRAAEIDASMQRRIDEFFARVGSGDEPAVEPAAKRVAPAPVPAPPLSAAVGPPSTATTTCSLCGSSVAPSALADHSRACLASFSSDLLLDDDDGDDE